jgi:hypothetical protein
MKNTKALDYENDWDILKSFLPGEWQEKSKELGALVRCRKFADAESLLRTFFIHLIDGCSLRETAMRADQGNIASISDVALLKRLKSSGEWLRWIAVNLMINWVEKQPAEIFGQDFHIRIIDGSTVQEPGSTGSTWKLHYSVSLPSLQCNEVHVTSPGTGESFKRFTVHPGDLFIGDRGLGHRSGINHVVKKDADVIVRINLTQLPLMNQDGSPFFLLEKLRKLTSNELGDWKVWIPYEESYIPGRVCAIKKSKQSTEKARRDAIKKSKRKGYQLRPETIESAGYTFVFTTLGQKYSPARILEMYRGRWQIELVFKRLKSLIGLGHLKKKDLEAAKAWIHGKLLVAFLVETCITAGEKFFPWGYPVCKDIQEVPLSLEGKFIYASPS